MTTPSLKSLALAAVEARENYDKTDHSLNNEFFEWQKVKELFSISATPECVLELTARIEALGEALKPFAEIEHSKYEPDDGPAFIEGVMQRLPTVGDLRRAARAYANKGEPK